MGLALLTMKPPPPMTAAAARVRVRARVKNIPSLTLLTSRNLTKISDAELDLIAAELSESSHVRALCGLGLVVWRSATGEEDLVGSDVARSWAFYSGGGGDQDSEAEGDGGGGLDELLRVLVANPCSC